MITNSIDYIGISNNLPTDITYFKEELFDTTIYNTKEGACISKVISASVDCSINSMKLLNTSVRTSNEGQKLTGKKLLIEVNLSYRIKYISSTKEKYLYVLKNNTTKVIYIVLPKYIEDLKIEELVRRKKIKIEPYIEDLYVSCRNTGGIYIRTLLLLNAQVKV